MLSVKLLVLNLFIENLVQLLCHEETPAFFELYMELLDRLLHTRRSLSGC